MGRVQKDDTRKILIYMKKKYFCYGAHWPLFDYIEELRWLQGDVFLTWM